MKRTLLVVALVLGGLTVAGCGDDRPCLKSHTDLVPITQFVGNPPTAVVTWMPHEVCDKYGPAPKEAR